MRKTYYRNDINITVRLLIVLCIALVFLVYVSVKTTGNIAAVFSPTKELPIYSVETPEKKIAISFDAAWGNEYTNDILDTLDKYKVKSTFFLVGFWADKYPEDVKEIAKRGHDVGNHSTTHPNMPQLSPEKMAEELNTTGQKIEELIGKKPTLFRPPFGDYNDNLIRTCRENGYYVIQWDVDSLDWKELGVQPVVDRVTRNVRNGSIVLFHNNAKYIKEYLPLVIERLQESGYEIVPISELIYKENFMMDNTGRQIQVK
ncbi:polysaccharide deacetylase family sporulation protein PdaB [Tissierella sp. P1]|jgi:polysaccharide deacetylase family sporulation protein PdaB|uniref:Polysaccharide deacetylase family sporulation protein PdaB n=1 Tax=Tissierella carlieri TaxID=689904 RepID=A0ABT1SE60_9FIRM|nr:MULTISPECIES: polysaccharide deacetylase family sporulation protein PdaB [Tissierella]MCQ4924770.1 polysaccharide deacetylase family sporulation protein PdaB [Tissierella carlieri]MDU5083508.1 polysaccharide deacetylase family sporulation protein PdaB [Bacillota bacterium]OZV11070.1 polysaccharide deacetylase family sporulation protein PdaB [Tissierella sp. P1]